MRVVAGQATQGMTLTQERGTDASLLERHDDTRWKSPWSNYRSFSQHCGFPSSPAHKAREPVRGRYKGLQPGFHVTSGLSSHVESTQAAADGLSRDLSFYLKAPGWNGKPCPPRMSLFWETSSLTAHKTDS